MSGIFAVIWLSLFQETVDDDIHKTREDESKDVKDGGDAPNEKDSEASIENSAETKFEEADVAAGAAGEESAEAQSGWVNCMLISVQEENHRSFILLCRTDFQMHLSL